MAKIYLKKKKKCSPSLAIREMQIETTWRFHLTPVTTAKINKQRTTGHKCWMGHGRKRTLIPCQRDCKLVQSLGNPVWRIIKNLRIILPYGSTRPLLSISPKDLTSYSVKVAVHRPGQERKFCYTVGGILRKLFDLLNIPFLIS